MTTLKPYHLSFSSGLHVGGDGVDLEETRVTIPSDTLFAAAMDAWRRLGRDPGLFVAPFVSEPPAPPFLLTSTFPFAGDVRFFPVPVDLARHFRPETVKTRAKDIKRIRYVSESLFRNILAGEALDAWLFPADEFTEPTQGIALQGGLLWMTVDEIEQLPPAMQRGKGRRHALRNLSLWVTTRVPRVTVDRLSSAPNIFYVGRTQFAAGCGLWFGMSWLDEQRPIEDTTYRAAWSHILDTLAEDGLGGERSVGYGTFSWEMREPVHLPEAAAGSAALLLSRYHPRADEIGRVLQDERTAYRLTSVAGWLRTPDGAAQRRRRIYMLDVGSVILWPGSPAGDVVDVRPVYRAEEGMLSHPVYRYGMAMAVGMKGR